MKKRNKNTKEPISNSPGLLWPALIPGTLVKRYNRFLADVKLESGETVTAHCANSGTMKECSEPGRSVYLSFHDNPKRKLKYTWEMIEMPTSLVGVNTLVPNRLVKKSIENGMIKQLRGYDNIKTEVKVSNSSRLDLMLTKSEREKCFVEIKNCTLVKDEIAYFPDAVTTRGQKHLAELKRLTNEGNRSIIFFLVQRMDARAFSPADDIDPAYGKELRKAKRNGVEVMVYDVVIDLDRIRLGKMIPQIDF
jgi:sugar fermentation stimulation protein A